MIVSPERNSYRRRLAPFTASLHTPPPALSRRSDDWQLQTPTPKDIRFLLQEFSW
jgi:hypothetical protein